MSRNAPMSRATWLSAALHTLFFEAHLEICDARLLENRADRAGFSRSHPSTASRRSHARSGGGSSSRANGGSSSSSARSPSDPPPLGANEGGSSSSKAPGVPINLEMARFRSRVELTRGEGKSSSPKRENQSSVPKKASSLPSPIENPPAFWLDSGMLDANGNLDKNGKLITIKKPVPPPPCATRNSVDWCEETQTVKCEPVALCNLPKAVCQCAEWAALNDRARERHTQLIIQQNIARGPDPQGLKIVLVRRDLSKDGVSWKLRDGSPVWVAKAVLRATVRKNEMVALPSGLRLETPTLAHPDWEPPQESSGTRAPNGTSSSMKNPTSSRITKSDFGVGATFIWLKPRDVRLSQLKIMERLSRNSHRGQSSGADSQLPNEGETTRSRLDVTGGGSGGSDEDGDILYDCKMPVLLSFTEAQLGNFQLFKKPCPCGGGVPAPKKNPTLSKW